MSAETSISLTLELAHLINNVPRNRKQLEELNKRCISLLSSLSDMELEERTLSEFLEEMEVILTRIKKKLVHWKSLSFVAAFLQQGEMQAWIDSQNKEIDDSFRRMITRFLVAQASLGIESELIHERDHDEIRTYLTHILTEFTPFDYSGRGIYTSQPIVSRSNTPPPHNREPTPRILPSRQPPQLPPISRLSDKWLITPPASESQISLPIDNTPSIWNNTDGARSGNLAGLVDYLIDHKTDDLSFKNLLLERFEEGRDVFGNYLKRYAIIKLIVTWVQTLPPDLVQVHQKMIQKAVDERSRTIMTPNKSVEHKTEPPDLDSYNLAVSLTLMEAEFYKTIRLIDYLRYHRGLPSRVDGWLSTHKKMIQWVKKSILGHDDMLERAREIKRFAKTAKMCQKFCNYNSMAAIISVLDEKSKPIRDLPHTMNRLSENKKILIRNLASIIDPDEHYRAYRKRREGKNNKGNLIPWCSNRALGRNANIYFKISKHRRG
ncbi:ras guanine nucleotide exchange factor domain-containing protein [Mycena rebaudengoi]|nr:ras guanine nucleotide exchange factor domain-containing protein [Mycena rebaudengoi]